MIHWFSSVFLGRTQDVWCMMYDDNEGDDDGKGIYLNFVWNYVL